MPSVYSLFLTFTQATHLPVGLLWCAFRAIETHQYWPTWYLALIHIGCFMLPTTRWRSQLTGGWFGLPQARQQPAPRAVPFSQQLRNVFIITLFAEYMSTASCWIFSGTVRSTIFTAFNPALVTSTVQSTLSTVDAWTPSFLMEMPLTRLCFAAGFGYALLYGGLATLLGEGLKEIKEFFTNWLQSAARLDAANAGAVIRPRADDD